MAASGGRQATTARTTAGMCVSATNLDQQLVGRGHFVKRRDLSRHDMVQHLDTRRRRRVRRERLRPAIATAPISCLEWGEGSNECRAEFSGRQDRKDDGEGKSLTRAGAEAGTRRHKAHRKGSSTGGADATGEREDGEVAEEEVAEQQQQEIKMEIETEIDGQSLTIGTVRPARARGQTR